MPSRATALLEVGQPTSSRGSTKPRHATKPSKIRDVNFVNMSTSKPLHPQCQVCSGAFTKFRHGWLFVCSNCGLLASNIEPKIRAHMLALLRWNDWRVTFRGC